MLQVTYATGIDMGLPMYNPSLQLVSILSINENFVFNRQ